MKNNFFFYDKKNLFKNLQLEILDIAKKSILKKNIFNIVVTGGKSILHLYKSLSKSVSNFDKWNIYISDERYLPKNHKDRNDRAIKKTWLNNGLIPKKNIKFICPELGLYEARKNYENILKKVPTFDLVLLSVGNDGHISSLFPGHNYNKLQNVVLETNSPKPPKQRISMSFKRLNNSKNVFKIIIGSSKKSIVMKLLKGEQIIANLVRGKKEKFFIHIDLFQKKGKR